MAWSGSEVLSGRKLKKVVNSRLSEWRNLDISEYRVDT
jgi:hypothetical protein